MHKIQIRNNISAYCLKWKIITYQSSEIQNQFQMECCIKWNWTKIKSILYICQSIVCEWPNSMRLSEFSLKVTNKIIKINVGDLVRNHLMQPFYGIQKYTNQPNSLIVMNAKQCNALAYWLCMCIILQPWILHRIPFAAPYMCISIERLWRFVFASNKFIMCKHIVKCETNKKSRAR